MLFNNPKKISPVWILAVPRSGSSLLVNFLNATNLFHPKFREFNLDFENKESVLANIPKYIKLQRIFFEIKNFSDDFDKEEILKRHPDVRFIVTQRQNIYEQTVSIYFAEYTKTWFIENKKNLDQYKNIKIPFNEKELLRLYYRNLKHLNCWDKFIRDTNYIKINYEDILKNYNLFFEKILKFLNIKINLSKAIKKITSIKMDRIEKKDYSEKLKKIIE